MSKTDGLDPSVPAGAEDPKLGDNRIRELARAVAEILNVDHYIGSDGGAGTGYNEDAAGEHLRVKFTAPLAADPTNASNKAFLYTKDVSSVVELFWEDEAGNVLQLTSGGVFNPALACALSGAQTIAGVKTFSSSPIVPTPTTDMQPATKKYADDLIAAFSWGQVCRIWCDAAAVMAANAWTKIPFETDDYDPDSISDLANNRITPNKAGYYQVNAGCYASSLTGGSVSYAMAIYKNGTAVSKKNGETGQTFIGFTHSDIVHCNGSTDYIEVFFYNGHSTDAGALSGLQVNDFLSVARIDA